MLRLAEISWWYNYRTLLSIGCMSFINLKLSFKWLSCKLLFDIMKDMRKWVNDCHLNSNVHFRLKHTWNGFMNSLKITLQSCAQPVSEKERDSHSVRVVCIDVEKSIHLWSSFTTNEISITRFLLNVFCYIIHELCLG